MLHGPGTLLIAAAVGYWVLERATERKGQLKQVGLFLGSLIIVVSVLGVVCYMWCMSSGRTGYCPMGMGGKGAYSPYTPKAPIAPSK